MSAFPRSGDIFNGRYQLLEVLGAGGVGTVFKAVQIDCNRTIALKILHPESSSDDDFKKRFVREARVLNELQHTGIVTVYHAGISESGLLFIAMEYVAGKSLRRLLNDEGKLSLARATAITRQAADALACVHEQHIVHRDLKPENMIIVDEPEPDTLKLIDFGLARFLDEQKATRTGTLIGSASYMSPEQCQGKSVDGRSDVYSLAACYYEMLTGDKPFHADNPLGLMYKHIHDPVPPVKFSGQVRFQQAANEVLGRAMAKKAEDRYQKMEEFSAALSGLIEDFGQLNSLSAGTKTTSNKSLWNLRLTKRKVPSFLLVILAFGMILPAIWFFQKAPEDNKTDHEQKPVIVFDSPACNSVLDHALDAESKSPGRGCMMLQEYINDPRQDNLVKAFFMAQLAEFLKSGSRKVVVANAAFSLAEKEYLHTGHKKDENRRILLACSEVLGESLLDSNRYADVVSLSNTKTLGRAMGGNELPFAYGNMNSTGLRRVDGWGKSYDDYKNSLQLIFAFGEIGIGERRAAEARLDKLLISGLLYVNEAKLAGAMIECYSPEKLRNVIIKHLRDDYYPDQFGRILEQVFFECLKRRDSVRADLCRSTLNSLLAIPASEFSTTVSGQQLVKQLKCCLAVDLLHQGLSDGAEQADAVRNRLKNLASDFSACHLDSDSYGGEMMRRSGFMLMEAMLQYGMFEEAKRFSKTLENCIRLNPTPFLAESEFNALIDYERITEIHSLLELLRNETRACIRARSVRQTYSKELEGVIAPRKNPKLKSP